MTELVSLTAFNISAIYNHLFVYSGQMEPKLWILGENFITMKESSNNRSRCGDLSCYQKSVTAKQICKKATRSSSTNLFGMSANILITTVVVSTVITYTLFDVLTYSYTLFDILTYPENPAAENSSDKNNLLKKKTSILLLSVLLYCSVTFYLFANRFQLKNFCLMNPNENICTPEDTTDCFAEIPYRFSINGSESCSFVFEDGYSIFIENFQLDRPGSHNFFLLDGMELKYYSDLKWDNRVQRNWDMNNVLQSKRLRRNDFACVESLKVKHYAY